MKLLSPILLLFIITTSFAIAEDCTNNEETKAVEEYVCYTDIDTNNPEEKKTVVRNGILNAIEKYECPDCSGECLDKICRSFGHPLFFYNPDGILSKSSLSNCLNCENPNICWKVEASFDAECPCSCQETSSVKLSDLTTTITRKGILLNWTTKTESDSQGFRMWRAIPKLDNYCGCSGNIKDYTQIQVLDKKGKPVLIPAKGSTTSGYDYSYLDEDAKPGIAYCYALEDVDSKGESKFYFEYVAFTPDNLE